MTARIAVAVAVVLAVVACGNKDSSQQQPPPPPAPKAAPPPTCDLAGNYRMRFRSNGDDGWMLRWKIGGGKAELTANDAMDLFPSGPLAFAADGCKGTITAHTAHSGNTKLSFTLDPATNAITGQLSRTIGGDTGLDHNGPETVPVTGVHDVAAIASPACLKPGVYEISVGKAKWKAESASSTSECNDNADSAKTTVRVEPMGKNLIVDEVSTDSHDQSSGRGKVTMHGDCAIDLALAIEQFSFDGSLTFTGDTATGHVKTAHLQVVDEAGNGAEGLTECNATTGELVAKRIAD